LLLRGSPSDEFGLVAFTRPDRSRPLSIEGRESKTTRPIILMDKLW
jgi:hypothetical protein